MACETLFISLLSRAQFPTGQLVITQDVAELIRQGRLNPGAYLSRHLNGDWGDLCDEDRHANDAALKSGDRLLSSYQVTPDLKLWIITEWDRSATTLLLPEEY